MADDDPNRRIQAGEAFMWAIENDPVGHERLRRLQDLMRALSDAVRLNGTLVDTTKMLRRVFAAVPEAIKSDPELQRLEARRQQVFDELAEAIKVEKREREAQSAELAGLIDESMRSANADLEAAGFDPPGWELEKWEHLARIIEKEPDSMTYRGILDWAMAWADREKLRRKLAKGAPGLDAGKNVDKQAAHTACGSIDGTLASKLANHFCRILSMDDLLEPIRQGSPVTTEDARRIFEEHSQIQAELEFLGKVKDQITIPIRKELRALANLMRQVRDKCRTYPEVLNFMPTLDWRGPADRGWDAVRAASRDRALEAWEDEAEDCQTPAVEVVDQPSSTSHKTRVMRAKRSTSKGDAKEKIVAVLNRHHRYNDGSCLTLEPIGVNELSRHADVSGSSATRFFQTAFQGYPQYVALCRRSASELAAALKLLNGDFSPAMLFGRRPHEEGSKIDDDDD